MLSLGKSLPNLTPFLKIPSRRSPNRPSPQKTDELTWFDLLHKNFLYFLCGSTKVNELYIVIYTFTSLVLWRKKKEKWINAGWMCVFIYSQKLKSSCCWLGWLMIQDEEEAWCMPLPRHAIKQAKYTSFHYFTYQQHNRNGSWRQKGMKGKRRKEPRATFQTPTQV